jgi:hypothetical protein
MTIILTSTSLNTLINTDGLKVLKKTQKNVNNANYYFNPNMGVQLYGGRVKFVDKKFLVLEFDKTQSHSLYVLLKHIDTVLQSTVKSKFSELFDKPIYSLYSENDTSFCLRCFLPNNNGRYFVHVDETGGDKSKFSLPRVGCIYDMCMVEIRNIWTSGDKRGFNLELKYVKIEL